MLRGNKKSYIALSGSNRFECLQLILWSWFVNLKLTVIAPGIFPQIINSLKRISYFKRYARSNITEHKASLAWHKGLWYEANQKTMDLTAKFYDQEINNKNNLASYYNKILNTNKFEAYIKKGISNHIFILLKDMHLIRLSNLKEQEILINKSALNKFVLSYMEAKYGIRYNVRWLSPLWGPMSLGVYYMWFFKEIVTRGVVFNRGRKEYKISTEASSGFNKRTLRNDMAIDGDRFKKEDLLILQFYINNDIQFNTAFQEAKIRGFDTVSVPKLRININNNIFYVIFFYLFLPLKTYFKLVLCRQTFLFYCIFLFHKRCFPIEMLMNLYHIRCHISMRDYGGIEETIILNRHGAKNVIFHWADITTYKAHHLGMIAHNVYFRWGDMHYCHHSDNNFIDKKVNIGCIFKKAYNEALHRKDNIITQKLKIRKGRKIAVFFDTSFSNSILFSECFFLRYIGIVKEFCQRNEDVNIVLKPKNFESYEEMLSEENRSQFRTMWHELINRHNFTYVDPLKWSFEEAIAIADICVSMGLNSPSTVALIFGKNALYFDDTGNSHHPFAKKYKDTIVFDDKELLFRQADNILNSNFNCRDIISEAEIRGYDAFKDDKALERLRDNLYKLTLSDG